MTDEEHRDTRTMQREIVELSKANVEKARRAELALAEWLAAETEEKTE
jgi:hypothetical protein